MQYDFKLKYNKLDSQLERNFQIPEMDWLLNKASLLFIKMIAEPRMMLNHLGFEKSQRNIDDIRTIVVTDKEVTVNADIVEIPSDYMFYLNSKAKVSRGSCPTRSCKVIVRQHDDDFEENIFYKSSYSWGEINALFTSTGIKLYGGDMTIDNFYMSYIRTSPYMHNAEGYSISGYENFDGKVLTGTQDCDLPEHTHPEIVDIAVLLAANSVNPENYQMKFNKLKLNI